MKVTHFVYHGSRSKQVVEFCSESWPLWHLATKDVEKVAKLNPAICVRRANGQQVALNGKGIWIKEAEPAAEKRRLPVL
jgi:hypothetical protein